MEAEKYFSAEKAFTSNEDMRPVSVNHGRMDMNGLNGMNGGMNGNMSRSVTHVADEKKAFDDKQEESFWKRKWRSLGQDLPVSGLRYATSDDEPEVRRVIWTILIVSGLGFMLYQVVMSFVEYYERPVDVAISYHIHTSIPFPAVTVCNENRFERTPVRALGIETEMEMMYPPYEDSNFPATRNFTLIRQAIDRMNASFPDVESFYTNITRPLNNFLFMCYFNGQPCNRTTDIKIRNTRMGQCFTFNHHGEQSSTTAGSPFGLSLLLDVAQGEYIAQSDFSAGVRLRAHPSYEDPIIEATGIRVPTGGVTQIQLERVERTYLKAPYGECTDSTTLKFYSTYTLLNCLNECLIDHIFTECGCYLLNGDSGTRFGVMCDLYQERFCVRQAYFGYSSSIHAKECTCKSSCDEIAYSMYASGSEVSNLFVNYISLNVSSGMYSTSLIRDDFAVVLVYFPLIGYTKLESTVAYTTTNLFNDLGGALGLMLGSTFYTLYEVFDFMIWAAWEKYKINRKVNSQSSSTYKAKVDT